jgi:TonB-dependent receptor
LKVGAAETYKSRTFNVYSYKHRPTNLSDISIDPDWFLQDENIWSADPSSPNYREGTYTLGNFQPANQYEASQNIAAAYVMAEQQIKKKLNLIYGVRLEYTLMFYDGVNQNNTVRYLNEKTLDALSVLPALNIVYKVTPKMNLRAGYSRTIARPSFKEKSEAEIYDPITKRTFSGNLDLQLTNIDNADLRYEFFIGGKDMLSVSGFYKRFDGHIELVSFETAPDNLKPRNSGIAQVFGGEFEIRKGLRQHTSSKFLQGFFFAANVSIVHSMVDMNSVLIDNDGGTELELRQNSARDGETIKRFRTMSGQSPYAVNGSISYEFGENRGNISLAYNVQGDQLSIIGSGRVPDVYTLAFHSLNFNAYVNLGEKRSSRISLRVQNLLDDDRTLVYRSYKAEDQIFTTFNPGMSIRIGYQYSF